ncbi:hypothetical protein EDD28_0039 [Salana multivorans]|uniref:Uncharacterized protein n=1 Tax=Salana multivorans TaxID=120377 RepID=A0A3N2D6S3_9MICO|nr:hypothetical protein [Salana multivorans]ROR95486.1 hypothetical protein EDD28_0039 [Salana multivorans]
MSVNLVSPNRIECNGDGRWPCRAFFEAPAGSYAHEARRDARREGWTVNMPNPYGGRRRLDYCPEHGWKMVER